MSKLQKIRPLIEQKKGERNRIKRDLKKAEKQRAKANRQFLQFEKAKIVINEVAMQTQNELRYHISELVDLPMQTKFGEDAYSFGSEFPIKRGKTEWEMFFEKKGKKVSPMKATEGGVIDVASFALRPAMFTLHSKQLRPVILLDEPFKFLSDEYKSKAGEMLSEISKKLGIQFIMVTHIPPLVEFADNVIRTRKVKGRTKVKVN